MPFNTTLSVCELDSCEILRAKHYQCMVPVLSLQRLHVDLLTITLMECLSLQYEFEPSDLIVTPAPCIFLIKQVYAAACFFILLLFL